MLPDNRVVQSRGDASTSANGFGAHSFFIACPPNSLRIAASSLSEYESASRDRKRLDAAFELWLSALDSIHLAKEISHGN